MDDQSMSAAATPPSRHAPRSKNGCRTCRLRKLKCDEVKPLCHRCAKAQIKCEWFEPGHSSLQRRSETSSPLSSSSSAWPNTSLRRLAPATVVTTVSPTATTASTDETHDRKRGRQAENDDDDEHEPRYDASSSLPPQSNAPEAQVSSSSEVTGNNAPRQSLSAAHVSLSNSLRLSVEDQECFLYVPDSVMVLRFGKPWKWSSISYIYANIAGRYPGVMRIFIAGAAMELRSNEILAHQDGNAGANGNGNGIGLDDDDEQQQQQHYYSLSNKSLARARRLEESAASHYHLALKDLSALLDHISRSRRSNNNSNDLGLTSSSSSSDAADDVDALFAMWFLILHFGLYDSESIGASHVHLDGIRSFLKSYLLQNNYNDDYDGGPGGGSAGGDDLKLPLASQQLLLYISYMDINFALGNPNGGRLWMDLLSETAKNTPLSHDRLFHSARSCLPKIWGAQYPVSELFDDLENYRPLHFLHSCQRPKLAILRLSTAASSATRHGGHYSQADDHRLGCQRLWNRIREIGEEFADVLTLAAAVPGSGGRRMIWTVYHAALEYYALQMLYSCLEPPPAPATSSSQSSQPWLDTALRQVSSIAHKAMAEDPRQVYRLAWPLCITLLKTTDSIHQEWLRAQLTRANVLLPNFGVHALARDGSGSLLGSLLESTTKGISGGGGGGMPLDTWLWRPLAQLESGITP